MTRVGNLVAVAALGGLMSTGACAARESSQAKLTLTRAEAVSCQTVCKGVRLDIKVDNPSDAPLCFSVRYVTVVSHALFLAPPDASSGDGYMVDALPLDAVPDVPDHAADYVALLRSEPSIYVKPHGSLTYTASTGDRYEIPRGNIHANLGFYVFNCEGPDFTRLTASKALLFPPR